MTNTETPSIPTMDERYFGARHCITWSMAKLKSVHQSAGYKLRASDSCLCHMAVPVVIELASGISNMERPMKGTTKFMTGRVLWVNRNRRYGVILPNHGKPMLMHAQYSDSQTFSALGKGQQVAFELVQTPKGVQAGNVEKSTCRKRFPSRLAPCI